MGYGYGEPEGTGTGGAAPSAATETTAGIAELATQAEVDAEADDSRIVTPLKLATRIASLFTRAHDRLHKLYSSADHSDLDASAALQNGDTFVWDAVAAKFKRGLPAPADASVTRAKMSQDNRGTIICTSTTRPTGTDAPEGQHIYETDTDKTLKNTGTETTPVWSEVGGSSPPATFDAVANNSATYSAATGETKVALETVQFGGGLFDTATSEYVVPETGLYRCDGGVFFENWSSTAAIMYLGIGKNGALAAYMIYQPYATTAAISGSGVGYVNAVAGDRISMRVFNGSGSARNILGGLAHTRFSVRKVRS